MFQSRNRKKEVNIQSRMPVEKYGITELEALAATQALPSLLVGTQVYSLDGLLLSGKHASGKLTHWASWS